MSLPKAVVGSNHTAILVTCRREDDSIVDITNSTITGTRKNKRTNTTTTLTGTMAIVSGTGGQFRWTYSTADVAIAGSYTVQFSATFADTTVERSLLEDWDVIEAQ